MLDDLDVCGVNVRVGGDEVVSDNGGEELWWSDGVLFCEDVASLLLCVGGDDDGVICLGVARYVSILLSVETGGSLRGLDVTLQKNADGHFYHGLYSCLLVPVNVVQPDVVLAITSVADLSHIDIIVSCLLIYLAS